MPFPRFLFFFAVAIKAVTGIEVWVDLWYDT